MAGTVLALLTLGPISSVRANGLPALSGPPTDVLVIDPRSVTTHLRDVPITHAIVGPGGELLAATNDRGLARQQGERWQFLDAAGAGLPEDHILRIATLNGTIWLAFPHSGLGHLEGERLVGVDESAGLPSGTVRDMRVFRDRIWVSTDDGLAVGDGTRFERFVPVDPEFPRGRVRCFHNEADRALWMGTDMSEVCRYDGSAWTRHDFKGSLVGGTVLAVYPAPDWLWFGTFGALYMWQDADPTLPTLCNETEVRKDLFTTRFITALAGSPRDVLVGTAGGGLYRFAIESQSFRIYTRSNGLADSIVNSVEIAGDRALVGTSGGLSVIDLTMPLPAAGQVQPATAPPPPAGTATPAVSAPPAVTGETSRTVGPEAGPRPGSPSSPVEPGTALPAPAPPGSGPAGPAPRPSPDATRPGRSALYSTGAFLFGDPDLLGPRSRSLGLSCRSCHGTREPPPGLPASVTGAPGTVDVSHGYFSPIGDDGTFNPRRIPSLEGIRGRWPYPSTGQFLSLREMLRYRIVVSLGGDEPSDRTLDALEAYLTAAPPTRSPHLDRHGRLLASASGKARRGEQAFLLPADAESPPSCASCHVPAGDFTDNRIHDVVTGERIKTPVLVGIARQRAYFHDGRAATLSEAVERHARDLGLHLDATRLEELTAYLELVGAVP